MLTSAASDYGSLLDLSVPLSVTAVLMSVAARIFGRRGY